MDDMEHKGHIPSGPSPLRQPPEWAQIVESAQEELERQRGEVERLELRNQELARMVDEEKDRSRAITSRYAGMRTKLDMAFGAPNDDSSSERTAKGRYAGLDGAVDFAVAKHAELLRKLRSQDIELNALRRRVEKHESDA